MADQNNGVLHSFNSLAGTKAFTCDNLEELQIGEKIGSGAYRDAYVGLYRDTKVAVKVLQQRLRPNKHGVSTVEREARAQINCLRIFHEHKDSNVNVLLDEIKTKCASVNMLHMLVEIVYHSVLKSDLIVENIGFCVRHPDVQRQRVENNKKASKVKGNDEMQDSIVHSSVISLYEFANDISEDYLDALPLPYRLRQMKALVAMIASLNETVVGPINIGAFQFRHIAVRNGKCVLIDLGSFDSGHILCDEDHWRSNKNRYTSMRETMKVKQGESCPDNGSCVKGFCKDPYQNTNRDRMCTYVWMHLVNSDIFKRAICLSMSTDEYIDYLDATSTL